MKYKVNWDNNENACGTFSNVFETEVEAQAFADNWMAEMNGEARGRGELTDEQIEEGEGYSAEVIEVEDEPEVDDEARGVAPEFWT